MPHSGSSALHGVDTNLKKELFTLILKILQILNLKTIIAFWLALLIKFMIIAIPCWTTMNWKFSSCSTYWTLYIITKLKILNFQKCIKKSLTLKVCKRILTEFMSKLHFFPAYQGTLVTKVTSKCLTLNFDVKFWNYA